MKINKSKKCVFNIIVFGLVACYISTISPISHATDVYTKKTEAGDRIKELDALEAEIKSDLDNMNGELYDLSKTLSEAQEALEETQKAISTQEDKIDLIEDSISNQERDMCLRIKYMYENSSDFSIEALFNAIDSFADYLNKAEYTSAVLKYDRKMLDEYEKNLSERENELKELERINKKYAKEKEALESDRDVLLNKISESEEKLNDTQEERIQKREELDALILKMQRIEATLAYKTGTQLSIEEAYAKEAEKEGTSGVPVTAQVGEEALLAAIIFCESGGESYESQVAVGSVVLNRVNNSLFPNTITDVIYSPGQFTPVASGRLSVVLANGLTTDSCRQAAAEVLGGNVTGPWLYFRTNNGSKNGTVIGKQVFY